jgi:hypothetical protein
MKIKLVDTLSAIALVCSTGVGQDIPLHDKVVTFTNLSGKLFDKVVITKGDLDGVIWRSEVSSGRVSYLDLYPGLLESWGIPTNRIDVAARRKHHRAALSQAEISQLRAEAIQKQQEWEAGAPARAAADAEKKHNDKIADLQAEIQTLDRAIAHDQAVLDQRRDYYINTPDEFYSATDNSHGPSVADTATTRLQAVRQAQAAIASEKSQLELLRAQLNEASRQR